MSNRTSKSVSTRIADLAEEAFYSAHGRLPRSQKDANWIRGYQAALSAVPAPETGALPSLPDDPQTLKRIIARHVRWRETALSLLQKTWEERGNWPALRDFLEQSNARVVLAEKAENAP